MRITKWRAILYIDGKETELHEFELDYYQKGWYISTTSISAFKEREGERLYKYLQKRRSYTMPGKRCYIQFGQDIEMSEEQYTRLERDFGMVHPAKNVPYFHHDSVWDFYKAIGYDYKKKRYIS